MKILLALFVAALVTRAGEPPGAALGPPKDKSADAAPGKRLSNDSRLKSLEAAGKAAMVAYIAKQEALKAKLKRAAGPNREQIAAEIASARETFLEETQQLRVEIRNLIAAWKSELQNPNPINAGSGGSGGSHRGHH